MRTVQEQIRKQMEDGNKVIIRITQTRKSKRGRKINREELDTTDLSLCGYTIREYVIDKYHTGSTNHYYGDEKTDPKVLEMIEKRTKSIENINGSVLITQNGYWDNYRRIVESEQIEKLK